MWAGAASSSRGALLAVEAKCHRFQLGYPADQALEQVAGLPVAARRLTHSVQVASRLGSDHWREVAALAEAARRSKRADLAVRVFQAADRPAGHPQRLCERCASCTGVATGEDKDSRRLRPVVQGSPNGLAQK